MNTDYVDSLPARVAEARPATLLAMGNRAGAAVAELCAAGCAVSVAQAGETPPGRFDAVLLGTDFAALDAAGWSRLLGHLRIHVSPRLWVLADDRHALADADYLALGFFCLPPWSGWRCYAYDLYRYKHTPEWLNARFWAHPERWEP